MKSTQVQKRNRLRIRFKWLILGLGVFSILCIALCSVLFFLEERKIAKTQQTYGETITGICYFPDSRLSTDMPYVADELPRKVVIFALGQQTLHQWFDELPSDWQAETKSEVNLVICIKEQQDVVEICEDDESRERIQHLLNLSFYTPDGKFITNETIFGDAPPECSSAERSRAKLIGNKITYAQFENNLQLFVEAEQIEPKFNLP